VSAVRKVHPLWIRVVICWSGLSFPAISSIRDKWGFLLIMPGVLVTPTQKELFNLGVSLLIMGHMKGEI
jgi:hypothetical protein